MKKIVLAATTGLLAAISVNAQQTSFGLKGGLNISSIAVDEGRDWDSKVGFHLGGLAHIHVSTHFAVQPELTFSTQGGKDGDFKFKLNYINVPVLLQYMTNDGFRIQTGPQIGFMTSGKTELGDVEVDVSDELSGVDFSWSFGAGYIFPSSPFGIDVRYNLGITNIDDTETVEERNRVFQVGLFYQFLSNRRRK